MFKGFKFVPTSETFYLEEYFTKQELSKIGYVFDPKELSKKEIEAFVLIAQTVKKITHEEQQKAMKKRK